VQPTLQAAIDAIKQGVFGDAGPFQPLISSLIDGKDYYCISDELVFAYLKAISRPVLYCDADLFGPSALSPTFKRRT
jgi:hypothetical protein